MTEPIRILHVIGLMDRGGAETLIMNFYRNIDRSKVQFDFVENRDVEGAYDNEIRSLGGTIYRCPHYNGKNHFAYVRWWNAFLDEHATKYRAIHGHLGSTAAIYLHLAKQRGLYTIAHSHNTSHISLHDLIYAVYSYPTRFIADFFFGCSPQAGADRYGKKITASNRYITLPNAIDASKFAFSPSVRHCVRSKYGIEDRFVIGHIGRFSHQKNHSMLIDIFSEIHTQKPDSVLFLIGDGELRSEIEQQIHHKNLSDSVIFAGVHDNVSQYYQAFDAFVFPSLYEGFGIVVLEAQASGLPCFISDTIPNDCIISEELVAKLSLSDTPQKWAQYVLSHKQSGRFDHSHLVADKGFDIRQTAQWLTSFYLNIGVSRHD